jgi:phthalate 4,5-dioxygenase oxygenase subunit
MAITRDENDLITRVEGDAPLGKLLRQNYWLPAVPSDSLVAGGKPQRVRLLGGDYVAFRSPSGEVGVLDEACPHRLASLALARNEEGGLRCIYHGWQFNTAGNLVETPNTDVRVREQFCKSVKTNKYEALDRGGIVWVWLGQGAEVPAFPDLPFTSLSSDQRFVTSCEVPTNWLQGVEATMDTTHLSFLHSSVIEIRGGGRTAVLGDTTARLEFEERPYGFRYAAIRSAGQDRRYIRVNNFVMPWYSVICASDEDGPATVFFSVPVDDVTHRAWFVHFNPTRRLGATVYTVAPDLLNFPPLPPGSAKDNWGQDRGVMARGHFSGFPQHLVTEDFAMFMSQGPIVDRTREQLCDSDGAIVRLRRILLQTVRKSQDGAGIKQAAIDYSSIHSISKMISATDDWRSVA